MSNKDPKAVCENCVHFAIKESKETECRKYAPRDMGGRLWAPVRVNDWCSEFEKSEELTAWEQPIKTE